MVAAVDVVAARDLVRSGGYRYLEVRNGEEPQVRRAEIKAHFDKQDSIVVGCKSGVRSQLACANLMAAGFENVKNMEGSFTTWVDNGFAVRSLKCKKNYKLLYFHDIHLKRIIIEGGFSKR